MRHIRDKDVRKCSEKRSTRHEKNYDVTVIASTPAKLLLKLLLQFPFTQHYIEPLSLSISIDRVFSHAPLSSGLLQSAANLKGRKEERKEGR